MLVDLEHSEYCKNDPTGDDGLCDRCREESEEEPMSEPALTVQDTSRARYICSKHGKIDSNFFLSIHGQSIGNYCLRCVNDLLAKHLEQLQEASNETGS